ncbi:MAG: hypothetical protein ACYC35_18390 [Pirellulales bacterium]
MDVAALVISWAILFAAADPQAASGVVGERSILVRRDGTAVVGDENSPSPGEPAGDADTAEPSDAWRTPAPIETSAAAADAKPAGKVSPSPKGESAAAPAERIPVALENEPPGTTSILKTSAETKPAAGATLVPVRPRRKTALDLLAGALAPDESGPIPGRGLSVAQALSLAGTRPRQTAVLHAYWRLSAAIGHYQFSVKHRARLDQFSGSAPDAALRDAAEAAEARLRAAQTAAVAAQKELASLVAFPAGTLPLPSDLPYVGPYRTAFAYVFATRTPPAPARLADRTLPIWRCAVNERALAVQAATDAMEATGEAYQARKCDAASLLASVEELGRQEHALVGAVYQSNCDIADYALSAATEGTSVQTLIGMLIRPKAAGRSLASKGSPAAPNEGAGAAQRAGWEQPIDLEPAPMDPTDAKPIEPPATTGSAEDAPAAEERGAMKPIEAAAGEAAVTDPAASPAGKAAASQEAAPVGLYSALASEEPVKRAKNLAGLLHWDRTLPANSGYPIDLPTCLALPLGVDRRQVIAEYWQTRQRAAAYQILAQRKELLDMLVCPALESRKEPAGPAAMVQLRAARLAAAADLREAHVALVSAQFALTQVAQRPLNGPWLLPCTAPHAGDYLLKVELQPREVAQSEHFRQLAARIPKLATSLQDRAATAIEADAARAQAAQAYQGGGKTLTAVLNGIESQTDAALAFVEDVTEYNVAIADYVLTVVPADMPADRLARALVLK